MTAIFPSLPGLGWSVVKSARFATRIQRAVNGRELRALDQPYPIWSWTLTYPLLRDKSDTRGPGPGVGYDELTPLDTARRSRATAVVAWLKQHGAQSATQLT